MDVQQRVALHHVVRLLHRGAHVLEILRDLDDRHDRREPLRDGPAQIRVKANHLEVVELSRLTDALLHRAVVDDLAGAEVEKAGTRPVTVGDVVALFRLVHRRLGPPDAIGQQHRHIQPRLGREEKHKGRQVAARGKVHAAVAELPIKLP